MIDNIAEWLFFIGTSLALFGLFLMIIAFVLFVFDI